MRGRLHGFIGECTVGLRRVTGGHTNGRSVPFGDCHMRVRELVSRGNERLSDHVFGASPQGDAEPTLLRLVEKAGK